MIRVVIVDDHDLVRMGLKSYIDTEPEIEIVGEARNGREAVQLILTVNPDVVLMDLLMPEMNGIEATKELVDRGSSARVVILTSSLEDEKMIQALRAGALSYVLKTSPPDAVLRAIHAAAAGESVLDAEVQKRVMGKMLHASAPEPWEELTEREREVLKAIASGKSNQEIADHLQIGIKTVKTHVSNILLKLGLQDRTQAAIYAIRNGLD
jgi:two-component system, NarL family, response regulator LiaR